MTLNTVTSAALLLSLAVERAGWARPCVQPWWTPPTT